MSERARGRESERGESERAREQERRERGRLKEQHPGTPGRVATNQVSISHVSLPVGLSRRRVARRGGRRGTAACHTDTGGYALHKADTQTKSTLFFFSFFVFLCNLGLHAAQREDAHEDLDSCSRPNKPSCASWWHSSQKRFAASS